MQTRPPGGDSPAELAGSPGRTSSTRAQGPPVAPLQRVTVQATMALLTLGSLVAIFWAGRTTIWAPPQPSTIRPAVLLQIDINRADQREFSLLPGIGPVLADRIVADRNDHGEFASIQELARVHGIGTKTIAQITVYCLPVGEETTQVALAGD